jgi:16S rRNA G966 N2-methylase RsmD
MKQPSDVSQQPLYDRTLLLHGTKRNQVLTLEEVQRYGSDSFADPDYIRLYGMTPPQWYAKGVRLLGRTAVECTRDSLADQVGRNIAEVAGSLPAATSFMVLDPFAGSCNTLYWILRHVPRSRGIAFEMDDQVFELTKRNIAALDRRIELQHGDYATLLARQELPAGHAIIMFVAPPWGTALDEAKGLDLRRTRPPITQIVSAVTEAYPDRKLLFAIQVYEKIDPDSLNELKAHLNWSRLKIYDLNVAGRNHGILLGARGWAP